MGFYQTFYKIALNRGHLAPITFGDIMIKVVKFRTGEEIIADVTDTDNKFVLDKPALIQLMPSRSDPNQIMLGLIPYAQYTKHHELSVLKTDIIWSEEPVDDLYNQYNSMYGTGIQLV